jgi:hypothetical protein
VKKDEIHVDQWVIYTTYPGADSEDGRVVSLKALDRGIAHVLYRGDGTPKGTRITDLVAGQIGDITKGRIPR